MKKATQIFCQTIAFMLIAFITNVYVTEYWCNIRPHEHDASEQSHHEVEEGNHHDADHHSGNSEHDKNCCSDFTSTFFSKLINPASANILSNPIAGFVTLIHSETSFAQKNIFPDKKYFGDLPPPKIPDIRIFTSSFLI